jgi:hypothetical protein
MKRISVAAKTTPKPSTTSSLTVNESFPAVTLDRQGPIAKYSTEHDTSSGSKSGGLKSLLKKKHRVLVTRVHVRLLQMELRRPSGMMKLPRTPAFHIPKNRPALLVACTTTNVFPKCHACGTKKPPQQAKPNDELNDENDDGDDFIDDDDDRPPAKRKKSECEECEDDSEDNRVVTWATPWHRDRSKGVAAWGCAFSCQRS